jgi:hypothetical protein
LLYFVISDSLMISDYLNKSFLHLISGCALILLLLVKLKN